LVTPGGGPTYSVLLPTHDRADVVGYAIRSVLAQTVTDFELLIVGDGCTDDTATVVGSFEDPRIRWFDLPKGPGFGYTNRNFALREARGQLVAFMAHDDLYLPDHLERLAEPFADEHVMWVYSRPVWVSRDGLIVPFAVDMRKADQLQTFLTGHNTIPASCVVYRRSCIARYGEWPEDLASAADWEYWKRIVGGVRAEGIAYLESATTLHFRASWRTEGPWGPPPLDAWLRAAERPSWPTSLRVALSPDLPEQAVFLERSMADPVGWPAALRAGVQEAIDILAWTGAIELREMDVVADDLRTQAARSEAERVELARVADDLRAKSSEIDAERAGWDAERAGWDAERAGSAQTVDGLRARVSGLESERDQLVLMAQQQGGDSWSSRVSRQLRAAWRSPRLHQVARRLPDPLFDAGWYRHRYPDVRHTRLGAWIHWRRHGWREMRDPGPAFDTRWYLERYPDVHAIGMDPLEHYRWWGIREGRQIRPAEQQQHPPSVPHR
jgi:Glycosyl transferase family 2